ncbi:MAG TPA: type IV pilus biogenesis/stability protein PilW [Steroidobacter sp.]
MKRAAIFLISTLWMLGGCVSTSSEVATPDLERAAAINLQLGIDYLRKGNLVQAKEKIERSLEQNPRSADAHSVAAMLYDRLNEVNKADQHYDRALSLKPNDPEIKNNYAVFLCQRKKRYDRGERYALEAAGDRLYATPEVALLNAGNCAQNAEKLDRAEEHYRQAIRLKPRFAAALLQMAELEYRKGEYLSARAFLERYLSVARTSAQTLWLGVRIERGLGNEAQAQHYARRLKNEYPTAIQTKELLESERNPG